MNTSKYIQVVNAHCEGENGSVVVGGVLQIPGATMQEKFDYLNNEGRDLQRFLCFEPRGVPHGSVNIVTAPTRPDADAGFVILQPDGAHPMSGSNAICVTTVLLEIGMVPMTEPETIVRLDTAAGLVTATARCEGGKCIDVTLSMVPSFVEALDVEIPYMDQTIKADIAFGGDAKVTIGNGMNLDLTFNPDFSQVEVDDQIINITRFEINLPEKRQFFIQNSDLFSSFGDSRDSRTFFSRRIGVARDENGNTIENKISAGLRLS